MELERKKDEINNMMKAPKQTPAATTPAATPAAKDAAPAQNNNANTNGEKKTLNNQPTDEEIANAVKTLAAVGLNPFQYAGANAQMMQYQTPETAQQQAAAAQAAQDLAQLQMMLGSQNNNNIGNNNMMNFLPYLMQNGQNNSQMSKEFLQTMMMTQMMPDFTFDTSKN